MTSQPFDETTDETTDGTTALTAASAAGAPAGEGTGRQPAAGEPVVTGDYAVPSKPQLVEDDEMTADQPVTGTRSDDATATGIPPE